MAAWSGIFCLVFGIGFSAHLSRGKLLEGVISDVTTNWKFMARFCFLSQDGQFKYYFEFPEVYSLQNLLLYYDDIWPRAYGNTSLGCTGKKNLLNPNQGQVITLNPAFTNKCQNFKHEDGSNWINCSDTRFFVTSRERWWYFSLANCDSKEGLQLKYKLHMTNGNSLWNREFSADETWILSIAVGFLVVKLLLVAVSVYVGVKLSSKQLFHTTYKLYIASLVFYTASLFIQTIAYGKYANDGLPTSFHDTKLVARLLDAVSRILFLLKLILMAKGYTITRGRLSQNGTIKIAVYATLYAILYAVAFIWEAKIFDEGKVLYFYESIPGYCLITLRLLGWMWFVYAVVFTIKHYPEKRRFYVPYSILYTLWFWATPIVILIAVTAMPKWTREKIVVGVDCGVAFVGYFFFLVYTWPHNANKRFPFHVKTTQIDVIEDAPHVKDGDEGFPDDQSLPNRPAAYSLGMAERTSGPNFADMFVVTKTRSHPDSALEGKTKHGCACGDDSFLLSQTAQM